MYYKKEVLLMTPERREILKSFRTTPTINQQLKTVLNLSEKLNFSESDIINDALTDFLTNFLKEKFSNNYDAMDDLLKQKIAAYLGILSMSKNIKINTPKQVVNYFKGIFPKNKETSFVLFLDPLNTLIKVQLLAVGNIEEVSSDYSEAIKIALCLKPCHTIFIHNHPGKGIKPSKSDIISTKKVYFACQYSNVPMADAMIIDEHNNYFSFVKSGYFKKYEKEFLNHDKLLYNKVS